MAEIIEHHRDVDVIHEPIHIHQSNGALVAVLLIALILLLLFVLGGFGRRLVPIGGSSAGTTIQAPKQIDVNINKK